MTTYNIDQIVRIKLFKEKIKKADYHPEKKNGLLGLIMYGTSIIPAHFKWGVFSLETITVEELKKDKSIKIIGDVMMYRANIVIRFSDGSDREFFYENNEEALEEYKSIKDRIKNRMTYE